MPLPRLVGNSCGVRRDEALETEARAAALRAASGLAGGWLGPFTSLARPEDEFLHSAVVSPALSFLLHFFSFLPVEEAVVGERKTSGEMRVACSAATKQLPPSGPHTFCLRALMVREMYRLPFSSSTPPHFNIVRDEPRDRVEARATPSSSHAARQPLVSN